MDRCGQRPRLPRPYNLDSPGLPWRRADRRLFARGREGRDRKRRAGTGGDRLCGRRPQEAAEDGEEWKAVQRRSQTGALAESLRDVPPRTEEQGLGGGLREPQFGADLLIGQAAPLTEQQSAALVLGDGAQRLGEVLGRRRVERLGRGETILNVVEILSRLVRAAPHARTPPR